jgi:hypothetical protein
MNAIPSVHTCPARQPVSVAIYTRAAARERLAGRRPSRKAQEKLCREYVRKRAAEGWFVSVVFSDAAIAGRRS